MKTAIILFSQTGHTRKAAQQLQETLTGKGHTAVIEEVTFSGNLRMGLDKISILNSPSIEGYDALVLAFPVQGLAVNSVFLKWARGLKNMNGKPIALLTTHAFPFPSWGGAQAIAQMRKLCEEKNGVVRGSAILSGGKRKKPECLKTAADELSVCLSEEV